MKTKDSKIHTFFFRCWWAILLLLFCYGFYLHGMVKKKEQYAQLSEKVALLKESLCVATERREDLLLQMESRSDPAWIEMLIKKHLGMVPANQIKVYFEKE